MVASNTTDDEVRDSTWEVAPSSPQFAFAPLAFQSFGASTDIADTALLAGITVSPNMGLITTESGGTATFTVVLTSQPTADVTVSIGSN